MEEFDSYAQPPNPPKMPFLRKHKKKLFIGGGVLLAAGLGTGGYFALKARTKGDVETIEKAASNIAISTADESLEKLQEIIAKQQQDTKPKEELAIRVAPARILGAVYAPLCHGGMDMTVDSCDARDADTRFWLVARDASYKINVHSNTVNQHSYEQTFKHERIAAPIADVPITGTKLEVDGHVLDVAGIRKARIATWGSSIKGWLVETVQPALGKHVRGSDYSGSKSHEAKLVYDKE